MFTLTGELDPGTALLQRCRMCGEAELCQEVEGGGGALLPVAGAHLRWEELVSDSQQGSILFLSLSGDLWG